MKLTFNGRPLSQLILKKLLQFAPLQFSLNPLIFVRKELLFRINQFITEDYFAKHVNNTINTN